MDEGTVELPLFPLRTVLFPGQGLPLRIFEDRYKVMVRELLDTGGEFGVVLIREGNEVGGGAIPHHAGTTATIEESQEVGEGRFVLNARGRRRFRVDEMLISAPYPRGRARFFDPRERGDEGRLQRALETVRATFPVYFRLALSLTDQWAKGLEMPADPHGLVDFLGPWLQVDEEAKQRLIEPEAASDRVAQLAELLDDLLGRTQSEAIEHRRRKFTGLGAQN